MNLILETDIGRDADDFFALLYLINTGVKIRAITISPGDPDQVTLVKTILKLLDMDIPVGVGKLDRDKRSVGGVHLEFLDKYGTKLTLPHDGDGAIVIQETLTKYPDCEFLCIGPLSSVGAFLEKGGIIGRATMQGGFVGYQQHNTVVERLDKFENCDYVSTFNLGGDKKGAHNFVYGAVENRQFVGKNVCHTILYNQDIHDQIKCQMNKSEAQRLFIETMDIYLSRQTHKAFHDPVAAVCHLHPEIGIWMNGKLKYESGKWGGFPCTPGDKLLIDIDRQAFWKSF